MNFSYNQQSTAEPKQSTFESIIAQLDNQIANAAKILELSRTIGDKIHGSVLTPVESDKNSAEPQALLDRFGDRVCHLDNVLTSISGQLTRINRAF